MRCKNCKTKFEPSYFLQKYCKNEECKSIEARLLVEKVNKSKKDAWKKEKNILKQALKTKSDYIKEVQPIINKIARLIDKGSDCMMCGKVISRKNGCHYHSVGSSPSLRYNLFNIWIGCHSCNGEKGGNIIGYDNVLIDKYNRERWEYIKFDLVRITPPLHLTIEDIKDIKIKARKIVKELEQLNLIYSLENRWILRQKYNNIIGVYKNNM